jgi:hypothetical protein
LRFEVLAVVLLNIQVFWDVMLCQWGILGLLYPEDGGTVILAITRNCSSNDTALPPRRF